MVVTRKDMIPVFHHTYDGNMNDTKVFKTVIGKIKNRTKELGMDIKKHTIVFDRGNNSKKNLSIVKGHKLHYVGALTPYHHKKLIDGATDNLEELNVDGKVIQAYRDKRMIWKEVRTVIVFISDGLKTGQIRGIYQSLEKTEKQLVKLQEALCSPRAKKRERKQLEEKVANIVKGQFIKNVIDWSIQEVSEGKFRLDFTINQEKLSEIEEKLGLRILMTDRHDWSTVDIIKAYHGHSMIEHTFKNIKNPYHLALRPQYHWTDQKIKVHFCVLGYLLTAIIWREARIKAQFKGSLDTLLDTLNNIRLAKMLEDTKTSGKIKATYKLEEMQPEEESMIDALEVKDMHNNRLKFNGIGVYN